MGAYQTKWCVGEWVKTDSTLNKDVDIYKIIGVGDSYDEVDIIAREQAHAAYYPRMQSKSFTVKVGSIVENTKNYKLDDEDERIENDYKSTWAVKEY